MTRNVASAMTKRGMGQGTMALYMTSNVTKVYVLIMGVWRAGGTIHASYPEDTADVLLTRIRDTQARWVFCDAICVSQVKAATAEANWPVEIFVFDEPSEGTTSVDELFADDGSCCPATPPNSAPDDHILILCTSGTTGLTKGAVYTNKVLKRFLFGLNITHWTSKQMLFLTKCTHITGLFFPIRYACAALPIVMIHHITKQNIFNSIQKYKPYFVFGFPTYLQLIATDPDAVNYDRSCIETVKTGGAAVGESFYRTMMTLPNIKRVLCGYGLTECVKVTTTIDLEAKDTFKTVSAQPPLTVGRLYPETFLKVVDLKTGRSQGPGQRGELVIKSPVMASGYLNHREETVSAFHHGWFRTGDLGYYDNQGYVFIVDRIKETFKYFNNHISPSELEDVILKHPAVAETAVFGIVDPNGGDHIPRALVVLKRNQDATAHEIQEFVNGKVASYKHLRGGVFLVEALPRGKTGKVERLAAAKVTVTL